MQWSAVHAILFIDVELPNYDAHVVWRKDPRHCPLTGRELTPPPSRLVLVEYLL